MREYIKPWKLATLGIGLVWLIIGSFVTPAPDWDIGICFMMGIATYLSHPWALRLKSFDDTFFAIALAWICVDGLYAIYWQIKNPLILELMRSTQWRLSLCYYLAAVLIWNYGDKAISASSALLARFPRQRP